PKPFSSGGPGTPDRLSPGPPTARLEPRLPTREFPPAAETRITAEPKILPGFPALRRRFRGLSRLPPRLRGSSGFSTRAIPASSPPPPGFNELSRYLGLFLGLLGSAAARLFGRLYKEIEVGGGRKAIIIFVPVPQLKSFQKIQVRLVRELEKKFSGKHVVFIAQRRILPKPTRKSRTKNKQKRPRSRTLTAVHDAILEDLVFPSEIVGKRIRVKLDGSRLIKVHLDKAQQNNVEHKVETFSGVYKKLTGKDVNFEFPEFQL
uniref:40S ribosomal protein S7 n=1 Tax=Bos taurus TaxID=9913 RepID=A0A3Q1M657_BOVIN